MAKLPTITQDNALPTEATKYWIGYDVQLIKMQRQSKYSSDVLSLALPVAEIEEADSHYQRWDLDEPEYH